MKINKRGLNLLPPAITEYVMASFTNPGRYEDKISFNLAFTSSIILFIIIT